MYVYIVYVVYCIYIVYVWHIQQPNKGILLATRHSESNYLRVGGGGDIRKKFQELGLLVCE